MKKMKALLGANLLLSAVPGLGDQAVDMVSAGPRSIKHVRYDRGQSSTNCGFETGNFTGWTTLNLNNTLVEKSGFYIWNAKQSKQLVARHAVHEPRLRRMGTYHQRAGFLC